MKVDYLVVGAGVTGLAFANEIRALSDSKGADAPSLCVLEADSEVGGYCKTIAQDGFVWDYSGHFFHFRDKGLEQWLRDRMLGVEIQEVEKRSLIRYGGRDIDFPFQKNIHQLATSDFIDCLHDLFFREDLSARGGGADAYENFRDMLYSKFGRGISERFLIPYNEKLYACALETLDANAMGRFFPMANLEEIVRNMRVSDNRSYNSTFTYPKTGAIEYIRALIHDLPKDCVSSNEALVGLDLKNRVATTNKRELQYGALISSAPFPQLLDICGLDYPKKVFSWNKVLVFNLGFSQKGPRDVHWMYFPDSLRRFYRVGFYDNINDENRMSLYVEIGAHRDAEFDVDKERERVLEDLAREGIIADGNELVSWHSVVLDPAYVHITSDSIAAHKQLSTQLEAAGVYSAGRYGSWTYCSIEDNMLEARALASRFVPQL